jgi:hypothetical protein
MTNLIKAKYNNKKIIIIYYFNIIMLSLYAMYKNGFLLYRRNLVTFAYIFKPLVIILGTFLITFIIDYLWSYHNKNKYELFNDYKIVFMMLIALALPININLFFYFSILFILDIAYFYLPNLKINYYAMSKLFLVLLLVLTAKYNYLSIYETTVETSLTTLDMFLGRNIGGIGTTNILLLLISFITLLTLPSYKREIPIYTIAAYFILMIIGSLFKLSFINEFKLLISSEVIYGSIFIATIPEYSPIEEKSKIINGIILGIFAYLFNHLGLVYESIFIAIILTNLLNLIKDKYIEVVNEK